MHRASRSRFIVSPVAHAVFSLVSCTVLGLGHGSIAHAQAPAASQDPAPPPATSVPGAIPRRDALAGQLKSTSMLAEQPPGGPGIELPTFIYGDRLSGRPELETVIDGNAELRRGGSSIRADWLQWDQPSDVVKARGNVRVNSAGNLYNGPELEIKLDTFEGFFTRPDYRFLQNSGYGVARRVDFIDDKRLVAYDANFTTCQRGEGPSWMPAWIVNASSIKFDKEADVGEASGGVLRFMSVPILAAPTFTFPLSDKRKSGLLPPTVGLSSVNGTSLTVPYYFDIAPQRDATFSPTIMSKRGVDLAGEFRYLERNYRGELRASLLPNDSLRDKTRWSYNYLSSGVFNTGLSAVGGLGFILNLNRVSDDNYWRDFPSTVLSGGTNGLSQRLLANDASVSWGREYFSTTVRALKHQTLQDVNSPIVPPYDRFPQLTAIYKRINAPLAGIGGLDYSINTDYTRFESDRLLTRQPNAHRTFALAQISRPWIRPAGYISPKLMLNSTAYQFDGPLINGARSASRTVPTFSLDSGLVFERNASFFGQAFTQTLEPRAFYVNTPYRNQAALPNYDSGLNAFNFATLFTENEFVGNDRISDSNVLTTGLTSRLLDPDTGAESLRVGIAQRVRFKDRQVRLPGEVPVSERLSDLLFGATVNLTPAWSLDTTVQYNPKTNISERATVGGRYSPSNYRVVSAAYRHQRNVSEQYEVGWQWPINDLWGDQGKDLGAGRGQGPGRLYSVGRLNYSVPDKKLVDVVVGLEYDGCCWIARVVLERTQLGTIARAGTGSSNSTRILFQLEFVGFSRIGNNPLKTLKANIPRYQYLREQSTTPSRFTNYD
ncbi:LPS-assembly protein LptD [Polaromonas eurypsychrophila]|uniref:LPS-assembly protein LptD n=1 Tax=Polaromonas eurypsychrophila TaxID=1614635 RepID=A0A916S972_9BURK|nr:LPS assembly protein LptD [Polaromonas eurypsychrophila]GGA89819.1 LPS-assembly protein LptD [Polaromonas eurypsychrophila]